MTTSSRTISRLYSRACGRPRSNTKIPKAVRQRYQDVLSHLLRLEVPMLDRTAQTRFAQIEFLFQFSSDLAIDSSLIS